jgi:dolichol-phosphate mannosyltransferase
MISIVIPIFNEELLIGRLHQELRDSLRGLGHSWEIVFVNDASNDRSLELLLNLQRQDSRIVVVELSRNWGHQSAIAAGLSVAQGDAVVLMDGDLQDPPHVIPSLVEAWQRGAQIVVAQRRRRSELGWRRWLFPLFYRLLGLLSDYPIPLNAGIFGLLDRKAVDSINQLTECNRYLPGLRAWIGYRTEMVFYDRAVRAAGEPKQTVWKLIKYALDAIFSFSYKPLRLSLVAGGSIALFALFYGVALITCRILGIGMFGRPVIDGYTSVIVSVLFLGGVQLMSIGILGEYIGRIYDEVKRRPLYLIQTVHQAEARQRTSDQPLAA